MPNNPRYVQIEPTTRCNFTCGFCAGRHLEQQDMELSTFKKLIDSLEGIEHVELQGEGEPLLHPDFFSMVRYLRTKFPQVRISLITNGSLFTADIIEELLEASLESVMVSLESVNEEEFQVIRGGKLSRVRRGLAQFLERKAAWEGPVPRVGFAVTLLRDTYAGLSAVAELYDVLGMDGGILLQPLQTMSAYRQFYDENIVRNLLRTSDRRNIREIIASDKPLSNLLQQYAASSSFYSELRNSIPNPEASCPWLEQGLYVSASGITASCCFVKDAEKDGFGALDGNTQSVLEQRQTMLNRLKAGDTPSQCHDCGIAVNLRAKYPLDSVDVPVPEQVARMQELVTEALDGGESLKTMTELKAEGHKAAK
ncbi:radical SAM protein [Marinimicrobium sp. ABcell2]|uniref:radical SAM protein n=1 Tax=Marinimicrobium sp. ABcell2 TaxID=3069751 RepID=UPI0027B6D4C7|nr:radical SAM protein [Marinimicrobium sp. ABcell2]MDQ2075475.1 radical SAM protein [Marinimicrobium sp. ABcell2]